MVENPFEVDRFGVLVLRLESVAEAPPKSPYLGYRLVNSKHMSRVKTRSLHVALNNREDIGTNFYYEVENPLVHSFKTKRVLYAFHMLGKHFLPIIYYMDKFGIEYNLT